MIDSHCHLCDEKFANEVDKIVTNFQNAGVEKVLNMSASMEDCILTNNLSAKYDCVYYAVGVHPENVDDYDEENFEFVLRLMLGLTSNFCHKQDFVSDFDTFKGKNSQSKGNNVGKEYSQKIEVGFNLQCENMFAGVQPILDKNGKNKLLAIGEIGLDYYWRKDNKEEQIKVFESQIKLAKKYNLPFIVHNRDASGDVLEVLKRNAPYQRTNIIHCFSASKEFAEEVFKLNCIISFSGSVTFNNAVNLQEIARIVPDDKFLVETDSPYLAPVPYRGKRNEPAYVIETASKIANLKNESVEYINKCTTENFCRVFDL